MGRDKARLPFRGGDLASAVAAAVASAAGNVTLVGHAELPAIPDRYPGGGPLGGILTALHHTGHASLTIRTGTQGYASGETCDYQFKTKLVQNVSPNPSTKNSSRRGSGSEFQGLLQA